MVPIQVVSAVLSAIIIVLLIFTIFMDAPKGKKLLNLQEWLKWAVTQAEALLGSGTGQLKLRYVYDLALKEFPWIVKSVKFEDFSAWVDGALSWMEDQISSNPAIKGYISDKSEE